MADIPQQRFTSSGASQAANTLAGRLEGFKNKFHQVAHDENVRIGTERAQQLKFSDSDGDGVTDAPEFSKGGIFSAVENLAFNKAADSLYRNSLENDIRGQMNKFKAEFSDDIEQYEAGVMGFRKALENGTDPRARQEALLSVDAKYARDVAPVMVRSRDRITMKSRQEAMYKSEARLADVQGLAQAGYIKDAAQVMQAYVGDVRGMIESGQISAVEGWKLERDAHALIHEETITGEVKRLMSNGKEVEALEKINKFNSEPNEYLTVDERDLITDNLMKEVDATIDIQDKIDDAQLEDIKLVRKENSTKLFEGILSGTAGNRDVVAALRNREITQEQSATLLTQLRTQGEGTTDDDVVLVFEDRIRRGEDISEEIKTAGPNELDQKTRIQLMRKNALMQEAKREEAESAAATKPRKEEVFTKNTSWKFYNSLVDEISKVPNALSNPRPEDKAAKVEIERLWFEGSRKIAESNVPNKEELWKDWANQLVDNEIRRQKLIPWDDTLGVTPEKALKNLTKKGTDVDAMKEGKAKQAALAEYYAEFKEQWPRIEGAIKLKEFAEKVKGIAK